jgi:Zn-dependent protease with chaperone function
MLPSSPAGANQHHHHYYLTLQYFTTTTTYTIHTNGDSLMGRGLAGRRGRRRFLMVPEEAGAIHHPVHPQQAIIHTHTAYAFLIFWGIWGARLYVSRGLGGRG